MEMFTLKQRGTAWMVCCRACGHEQALPPSITESELADRLTVKCERCPSEEPQFHFTATVAAASTSDAMAG